MKKICFIVVPAIFVGLAVSGNPHHWREAAVAMGVMSEALGFGLWLLGTVYNPATGRRETLFD